MGDTMRSQDLILLDFTQKCGYLWGCSASASTALIQFDLHPPPHVIYHLATPSLLRALSLLLVFLVALPLQAQHEEREMGELIIRLNPEASIDALNSPDLAELGLYPIRNLVPVRNIWLVGFDESAHLRSGRSALDILSSTRAGSDIMLAQFNHRIQHRALYQDESDPPNDPRFNEMWGLHNTGQSGGTSGADVSALKAWAINTGGIAATGEQVVVAVIDNGFDLNHPDVDWWKNENETSTPDGQDTDGNGYIDDYHGWNSHTNSGVITSAQHGTHVSGTVAARGDNGIGVVGVNWNAAIMPIQGSSINEAPVVAAYGYVLTMRELYNDTNGEQGAFVVATNASFGRDQGNPANFPIWCGMYDEMGEVGIISAGATANANWNIDVVGDVPTACPSEYLIAVTNTDRNDNKNAGAAYGLETIDLGAPGTAILSTNPGNSYGTSTGTSMATPHVAGAVALLVSAMSMEMLTAYKINPADGALLIRDAIFEGVDEISGLQVATGGRLNLFGALEALSLTTPPVVVPELAGGSLDAGYFDGTSSLVSPPTNRLPTTGEMSLGLWVEVEEPGTLVEITSEEGDVSFRLDVVENDDDLVLQYSHTTDDGDLVSELFPQIALTDGAHHVFVTRGGEPEAIRVHLDGQRVGAPFFLINPPSQFNIGNLRIGNSFNEDSGITALIDEVRVYNVRLLSNDLYDVHESFPYNGSPAEVVAYYRFSADSTGFVFDYSGSNSGADWDGGSVEISSFPVGSTSSVLLSGNTSGTVGEPGATISATLLNPGINNRLAIYTYDFSEENIPADDLPWWYMSYSAIAWGAHGYGDASANISIDFSEIMPEDDIFYGLLHRPDSRSEWVEVADGWEFDGSTFSASNISEFGQWAIAFGPPVSTDDSSSPEVASLSAAYPNPVITETAFTLNLPNASEVTIELFDILGRRVSLLHDGLVQSGATSFTINSTHLAAGTYILRAIAMDFEGVQRITVVH